MSKTEAFKATLGIGPKASREYTLQNDDALDVAFTGWLAGMGSSRTSTATRWKTVEIYRTTGGSLVAHVIGHSTVQGERTRYTVHVADTPEKLVEKVGTGRVEKAAYADAGIPCVERIS